MTTRTTFRIAFAGVFVLSTTLHASDWPAYRHDLARSGVTQDKLPAQLHLQWRYAPPHKPRPAWPEPGRELHRIAFDYAYEVTAAGGLAYFGSSADHKVYALDMRTGRERWSFITEGPVRFAPTIEAGRVFVASDDGWLYCLAATDGKLLWRFRGGLGADKVMGNEQMVSRWPLRAGVTVEGGIVYFSAGMWPNDGMYFYALRAVDGKVVWLNDTSGSAYMRQPHPPSVAMTGVSPQGYIFGGKKRLFLPTGRNVAAAYDRATGEFLYYHSRPRGWGDRWGGCWNMVVGDIYFGWRAHIGADINVMLGEYAPHKDDGMAAFDIETGTIKRDFKGKLRAVVSRGTLYALGGGKVSAYDFKAWADGAKLGKCTKWETPHGRAYELILAGDALVVGGSATVTVIAADSGKVLWKDKTGGQARSLAVADGRLLVSTTQGEILCYGAQAVTPSTISSKPEYAALQGDNVAVGLVRKVLRVTGKSEGYCLVPGAGDGRFLYELTNQSKLRIWCAEPDAGKAGAVRRAMAAAQLNGVRVTVQHGAFDAVSYPAYFADLIVVRDPAALSAAGLYRVLRPCGGTAYIMGDAAKVKAWLVAGRVPAAEIKTVERVTLVVRGKLPGAANWTHEYANAGRSGSSMDDRVKLPLKLLWFGKPGPMRLVARHWRGPAPLAVDGRMFVIGQYSIMAVDAYNGRQLWRRDFPAAGRFPVSSKGSNAAADADSVYLVVGKTCTRLDAATGQTVAKFDMPAPPPPLTAAEAKNFVWSALAVTDHGIFGTMGGDTGGRAVFTMSKDGKLIWSRAMRGWVSNNAIAVDNGLVYLIDGVSAAEIDKARKRGQTVPAAFTLVALNADTGEVAWQTTEGIERRNALALGRGVLLATVVGSMSGYDPATGKLLYVKPAGMRKQPVIVGDTIYAEPVAYDLRTGEQKLRTEPITGAKQPWFFHRTYGCGAVAGGAHVLMFRSGALGICDISGDSGVHNFGGVRAGCYINAIASNGLLLMPPADASCTCSYSFQTTLALMPARKARNWSIFYDRLPNVKVKHIALNFGAPGDCRGSNREVWLAMPRPDTRGRRHDIGLPFRFELSEGSKAYRQSLDRVSIGGTDSPWVYANGLEGIKRAELDLDILERGIAAWPTALAPKLDGRLDDACWDGYKAVPIAQRASVTMRHDDANLYVAYTRPAAATWKAKTKGQDAKVWQDDSYELFLSSANRTNKCLHLGVSASGARYDALWTYVTPDLPLCAIPKLDVTIDGNADDWADNGLEVQSLTGTFRKEIPRMRNPKDFDQQIRVGWNDQGVALLVNVRDNVVQPWRNMKQLWRGDSVEIFMTPKRGSTENFQVIVAPSTDPKTPGAVYTAYDNRKTTKRAPLAIKAAGKKTANGYTIELLLPWKNLNISPAMGSEFGMQLYVNDCDNVRGRNNFRVQWHPAAAAPTKDPLAYQRFRLADKPSKPIEFKRGKRKRWGLYQPAPPYPYPPKLPPLGANGEDAKFNATWTSAVRADADAFNVEFAIPFKTLADAGFDTNQLIVDIASRGPLREPPKLGHGEEKLLLLGKDMTKPRTLSLRLHFAELDDVKPGERVFDVKVQGKVALKDFDVVKAAGGRERAVVKQIDNVVASRALTLEFVPKTPAQPILCGVEIVAQ